MIESKNNINSFLNKNNVFAIVGATCDSSKYGYKILQHLIDNGFDVVPINPKYEEILGVKCYPNLKNVNRKINVLNFVVPPKICEEIFFDNLDLGIDKIWLQPGAESKKIIDYCNKHSIDCVYNQCIMLATKK